MFGAGSDKGCKEGGGSNVVIDKLMWHEAYGRSDVPAPVRGVGYAIWDETDEKGENAGPGVQKLSEWTLLSARSVMRHLAENVERGWLEQVSTGSRSGNSVYQLAMPAGAHGKPASRGLCG